MVTARCRLQESTRVIIPSALNRAEATKSVLGKHQLDLEKGKVLSDREELPCPCSGAVVGYVSLGFRLLPGKT